MECHESNEILVSQRKCQLIIFMLELQRLLRLTILEKNNDHKNRQFCNKATPAFENILQHLSIRAILLFFCWGARDNSNMEF